MSSYILFLIMGFSFLKLKAQNNQLNTDVNWTGASNGNNGVSNASVNASITLGRSLTVNMNGEYLNLSMVLSSLIIGIRNKLTINGVYTATTVGKTPNNGTLILKGNLTPALGSQVLKTEVGMTSVSGLTFPNFNID